MKDALGHGSNGSGDGTLLEALRARLPHTTLLRGGGIPQSSNKAAGDALAGALTRTQAPVHPAFSFGVDRSSEIAYANRARTLSPALQAVRDKLTPRKALG